MSFKNKSKLIESLIKKDRLDLAADFVMEMLHSKTHPNESVFRFYCKTLVSNADVARIEAMAPYLTEVSLISPSIVKSNCQLKVLNQRFSCQFFKSTCQFKV